MKNIQFTTPVNLISLLDVHNEKHNGVKVNINVDGLTSLDFIQSMGLHDVLAAYEQFTNIQASVRFPTDFMTLAGVVGLHKDNIWFSKSAFVVFKKPDYNIFGTTTDLMITAEAFERIIERNLIVISTRIGETLETVTEWCRDGKILTENDLRRYGFKIMGDDNA